MLTLGTDEMTIVIRPPKELLQSLSDWTIEAEHIIRVVSECLYLDDILLLDVDADNYPAGYTAGLIYYPYVAIAYNPIQPYMGVTIKYSAYGLASYIDGFMKCFNKKILAYCILIELTVSFPESYMVRLSRIDFTADYIDEGLSVDKIFKQLNDGTCIIKYRDGRINRSMRKGFQVDTKFSTFYIGSGKKNVDIKLRVYDKKKEQEETKGVYLQEARHAESWVRFEAEIRGKYAHQISDALLQISTEEEILHMIAETITSRYCFYDTETDFPEQYTQKLLEQTTEDGFSLKASSPRDNELYRSFLHIKKGSGLYPLFMKIETLYGKDGLKKVTDCLMEDYEQYEMNEDTAKWLKKHRAEYSKRELSEILMRDDQLK